MKQFSDFFPQQQSPQLPVIAAPMAGGPSTPELVAAVARSGGFGFLAGGYLSVDSLAAQVEAVAAVKVQFGLNLFMPAPAPDNAEQIQHYRQELMADAGRLGVQLPSPRLGVEDDGFGAKLDYLLGVAPARPAIISFTFGCPDASVVSELQDSGCTVAVTVTTAEEAALAEQTGADLLVAQHPDAGGHSGAFLNPEAEPFTGSLPELLATLRSGTSLPLIAAGGISTAAQVTSVLDAGALAAQVGTAFLTAREAGTKPAQRRALSNGEFTSTGRTRAFSGKWARGLTNRFMAEHADAPAGYPAIHYLTSPLRAASATAGDAGGMNLWAGTGFPACQSAGADPSAAQILQSLQP